MRRLPLVLLALPLLVLSGTSGSGAQSGLPPCEPSTNGQLSNPELIDPEQHVSSRALYATHRLQAKLSAVNDAEDPDLTRYDILPDSEQLAPGPGVVGRRAYIGEAAGPVDLTATWTVRRGPFGYEKEPYCTGSEQIHATLRKPSPTTLGVLRLVTDLAGDTARVKVAIASRPSDHLRPLTVRMRRGARGTARELFTMELANVSARAGGYRFSKRYTGVTVRSAKGYAPVDGRALATVGVWMPRLRDGHGATRSFTLELTREGEVLLRIRAVIACQGMRVGPPPALQSCSAPLWRVTRPGA
jgi:hypothetical protein